MWELGVGKGRIGMFSLQPLVNIVIDVHLEPLTDVEPTLVSALVASGRQEVVLISQDDRPELRELAETYGVKYEFGGQAIVPWQKKPTLVLTPGLVNDPTYLNKVLKRGTPRGAFLPPTSAKGAVASVRAIGAALTKPFRPKRGYERALERQNVSMKAWVAGVEGACIDIHQRGGGFLVPKSKLAAGARAPIEVECRLVSGDFYRAKGTLTVRNIRPATTSGETWRVGGELEWDTPRDLAAVIEHAFVVSRFVPENFQRAESRSPVSIPASIGGVPGACVDLSEHGAAFNIYGEVPDTSGPLQVELHLANGQQVRGELRVRGVHKNENAARLSGLVFWENKSWLVENTQLIYAPKPER
jgi:PilZ domain